MFSNGIQSGEEKRERAFGILDAEKRLLEEQLVRSQRALRTIQREVPLTFQMFLACSLPFLDPQISFINATHKIYSIISNTNTRFLLSLVENVYCRVSACVQD